MAEGGKAGPLAIHAGREAAATLARHGWDPSLFSLLLGASGGPKWFILAALDRFLFGDYLQRSTRPLAVLGSSVGAWRHACLAQADPVAAIDRFAESYLGQVYTARPAAAEVSRTSLATLDELLGSTGAAALARHPRITSHIVTARGRGPCAAPGGPLLALGLAAAAGANALGRRGLGAAFQRVLFTAGSVDSGLPLRGFGTTTAPLTEGNVRAVLHASGSIPFLLSGERDIPGAPPGQYWDGGIVDYHFDPRPYAGSGLILYPHFRGDLTPGWFDKFLPWRRLAPELVDRLVLVAPHPSFVATLPGGKIPDRGDFTALGSEERVRRWRESMARGQELAEAFAARVAAPDPLAGVRVS
ncbi:MAG TPA: patatin-like phospholipase family protein [Pseudohaliea sp.]|nr:patatin-like phospholipase family protein [Pseudohaliea sp.]